MDSIASVVGRCLAGCAGALLIYGSLFLYKEEEGELNNVFEKWWKQIAVLRAGSISRETAFLKKVAILVLNGFEFLFGKRLLGPKAIAASMCYSIASAVTALAFSNWDDLDSGEIVGLLTCGLLYLVLSL